MITISLLFTLLSETDINCQFVVKVQYSYKRF